MKRFEVISSQEDWAVACVMDNEAPSDTEVVAHFAWMKHAHLFADLLNSIDENTGA